jgi:hypothetical protein
MQSSLQSFNLLVVTSLVLLVASVQLRPVQGSVLASLPSCDGCYCLNPEDDVCPALPTIPSDYTSILREFTHANPTNIQCDPFSSASCVQTLEAGQACAVTFTPSDSACPEGYTYT